MKALIAVLLLCAISTPVLAGYKPPRTGGPSSSRGGGGTRVLAPALELSFPVMASRRLFGSLTQGNQKF